MTKRKVIKKKHIAWIKNKLSYLAIVLACGGALSLAHASNVSRENSLDRIEAGQWVVASMYWEDKLVSTGKSFNPIGWHAAHKTLPIGTLIRVSNPKNHRSITVTINDRGPFAPGRDLDSKPGRRHAAGAQRARHRLYGSAGAAAMPKTSVGRSWKTCSR